MELIELAERLRRSMGVIQKQDIQAVAPDLFNADVLLGDDCAAIPEQDGYLLLAAEGMWPLLVETEPWFAGWCSVLVNVSDIYAMGGYPIAIVDALWGTSNAAMQPLWAGIVAASKTYGVPIVGGHTNCRSPYNALSVAILGRATHLLTSFNALPGDMLLLAIDLRGVAHPKYPFWNASTEVEPALLRGDLAILPRLAESSLCDAGKDISMGGIIGTLLMFLETSRCGAVLKLEAIPRPLGVPIEEWLLFFPSYGFLLSVRPENIAAVRKEFHNRNLSCEVIGEVNCSRQLSLKFEAEETIFWDLSQNKFMGFAH